MSMCSFGSILKLAVPMILAMTGQTLMHFLDGVFPAQYSDAAIAAAGPAGMSSWLLISLFNGAAGSTTTFVAQYKGAGRSGPYRLFRLARHILRNSNRPDNSAVRDFFGYKIFAIAKHDPEIVPLEAVFFTINCWAAPLSVISSAVSGFFSEEATCGNLCQYRSQASC